MKDSLLYWCDVVEKAERFVWLISKAQALWMYQEVPMTVCTISGILRNFWLNKPRTSPLT